MGTQCCYTGGLGCESPDVCKYSEQPAHCNTRPSSQRSHRDSTIYALSFWLSGISR